MNLIKLKRNELKCSWSLLDRVNNLSTALEQEIIFFKDSEAKLFQKLKHAKAEKAQMPKDNKALEQQLEEVYFGSPIDGYLQSKLVKFVQDRAQMLLEFERIITLKILLL
jgi:hypothetical protein